MSILEELSLSLQKGKTKAVKQLVQDALDEELDAKDILEHGLISGMDVIGRKFKKGEVYLPEVMLAARAMNAGVEILKPYLAQSGVQSAGKVCIGTVKGDQHDIGKNLVKIMMEGRGLTVIDLGTDVPPQKFIQTAMDEGCQIIACSALLTTTMGVMKQVVEAAESVGIRDHVKIMVGGAPVTAEFCAQIGADRYTPDAASAADAALEICGELAG